MNDHQKAAWAGSLRSAALVVVVVLVVVLAVGVRMASAQDDSTSTTTSSVESTTTSSVEPTTTTTAPPVTTTTAPRVTTTTARVTTTSTAEETTTTTVEETTTTTAAPTTTTEAPTIITPSTADVASAGGGGLSTSAKLAVVIGGLLAVAAAITVLTILYWRHTRPAGVALADGDEIARVGLADAHEPTGATAAVAAAVVPSSGVADPQASAPTEPIPVVPAVSPVGGTTSAADNPAPVDLGADLWNDRSTGPNDADDATALREALFGPAPVTPSERPVTLEELFGSVDDSKGTTNP